jgi:Calx-beta domain
VTSTLIVAVTPNTAPTLIYQDQAAVVFNGSLTVNPVAIPSDNGSVKSIVKQSSGTFTGDITVNSATGGVFITNAAPAGTHTITIRATDNCGAITDRSFTLTVSKGTQTIMFDELANKTFGDPDFGVSATASSNLPVTLRATGNCTMLGNKVHLTGSGSCTVTALQDGDANFLAAPDVARSFSIAKGTQTITFGALANKTFGDPDFAVSATSTSGLPVSFAATGQCTVTGNTVHINSAGSCTITASQTGDSNFNPAPDVAQSFTIANSALVMFSQANYDVNESTGLVTITVNRTGDLSVPVNVDYVTDDTGSANDCSTLNTGMASARCDFGLTLGTLKFAATETQKTFTIPITQDSYAEGAEPFNVKLSNPTGTGAALATPSSATVTINDSAAPAPNAIDDTEVFVRQQYRDFLNREADPAGLAFWTGEIDNCTPKPQCTELKRIHASAAFFLSIEFQATGQLVRNFYVASLNRPATNNMPEFVEFLRDTQAMQLGVIVDPNNDAWKTVLKNNSDDFMKDFVTRAEFVGLYPTTDTPTQYVDKLYLHAGITPTTDERNNAIAEFGTAPTAADADARGRALLAVTENATFQQREKNPSFVQMQYFGYLRRNPNDEPDGNFAGFDFWLAKLNQFQGNFQDAEMVKAFISSGEYRARFGP